MRRILENEGARVIEDGLGVCDHNRDGHNGEENGIDGNGIN